MKKALEKYIDGIEELWQRQLRRFEKAFGRIPNKLEIKALEENFLLKMENWFKDQIPS